MIQFLAQRVGALLIGLVLGLVIAIGMMVFVSDLKFWWILVVIPLACGLVCALVGDRALATFKDLASWF